VNYHTDNTVQVNNYFSLLVTE